MAAVRKVKLNGETWYGAYYQGHLINGGLFVNSATAWELAEKHDKFVKECAERRRSSPPINDPCNFN
jgi:hypothetical protein